MVDNKLLYIFSLIVVLSISSCINEDLEINDPPLFISISGDYTDNLDILKNDTRVVSTNFFTFNSSEQKNSSSLDNTNGSQIAMSQTVKVKDGTRSKVAWMYIIISNKYIRPSILEVSNYSDFKDRLNENRFLGSFEDQVIIHMGYYRNSFLGPSKYYVSESGLVSIEQRDDNELEITFEATLSEVTNYRNISSTQPPLFKDKSLEIKGKFTTGYDQVY